MSTRIDISVAADLLRRLNRSQSQANRQGLQERERRDRLTQQGTTLRQQQNAAAGLNFDGSIYRRRPMRPRFLEEPAATPLLTAPGFVLVPHAAYEPQGIPTLVRRLDPLWFDANSTSPMIVDLAGGPDGVGALVSPLGGAGAYIQPAVSSLPFGKVISKPHTFEALINLSTVTPGDGIGTFISLEYYAYTESGSVGGVTLWWQQFPRNGAVVSEVRIFGLVADIYIISVEPTWQYQADYIVQPAIHAPNAWRHLAYVSSGYTAGQPLTESLYFNGVRIYAVTGQPVTPSTELLAAPVNWWIGDYASGDGPPKIHGYRYTQKALYTGESFTPPTTITGLA